MPLAKDINEYLRARASELAERILRTYPPLHGVDDPGSSLIDHLLRMPFPAQTLAMMGGGKRWQEARGAAVIAACGPGKTLDLARGCSCPRRTQAFHGSRHGSASVG